jgi:hypothetical protein
MIKSCAELGARDKELSFRDCLNQFATTTFINLARVIRDASGEHRFWSLGKMSESCATRTR